MSVSKHEKGDDSRVCRQWQQPKREGVLSLQEPLILSVLFALIVIMSTEWVIDWGERCWRLRRSECTLSWSPVDVNFWQTRNNLIAVKQSDNLVKVVLNFSLFLCETSFCLLSVNLGILSGGTSFIFESLVDLQGGNFLSKCRSIRNYRVCQTMSPEGDRVSLKQSLWQEESWLYCNSLVTKESGNHEPNPRISWRYLVTQIPPEFCFLLKLKAVSVSESLKYQNHAASFGRHRKLHFLSISIKLKVKHTQK